MRPRHPAAGRRPDPAAAPRADRPACCPEAQPPPHAAGPPLTHAPGELHLLVKPLAQNRRHDSRLPSPLPARRPVAKTTAPGACAVELGVVFPLPAHRRGRDPRARAAPHAPQVGWGRASGRGGAARRKVSALRGVGSPQPPGLERRARGCRGLTRGGRARGSSRPGSGRALPATGGPFGVPCSFLRGLAAPGGGAGAAGPALTSPAPPCPSPHGCVAACLPAYLVCG